jgi:hypothetical protein
MSCIDPATCSVSLSLLWAGRAKGEKCRYVICWVIIHATAVDVFSTAVASLIVTFRKTNGGMGRADCNKQICVGQILKYNVEDSNPPNSNETDVTRSADYCFPYWYFWFTENLYVSKECCVPSVHTICCIMWHYNFTAKCCDLSPGSYFGYVITKLHVLVR